MNDGFLKTILPCSALLCPSLPFSALLLISVPAHLGLTGEFHPAQMNAWAYILTIGRISLIFAIATFRVNTRKTNLQSNSRPFKNIQLHLLMAFPWARPTKSWRIQGWEEWNILFTLEFPLCSSGLLPIVGVGRIAVHCKQGPFLFLFLCQIHVNGDVFVPLLLHTGSSVILSPSFHSW